MNLNSINSLEMLPDNFQYVAELVGLEKAIEIVKHFGGSTLYIPKIDCCHRYSRNQKIVRDYKSGLTYSQIAIRYNLTTVSVRNIIASCL